VSSHYEARLDALARDALALEAELRDQETTLAILRDPASRVAVLSGLSPAPAAHARILWQAETGGVFVATGLPTPPAGKTYQLWALAGSAPPVSAGVFGVDASGTGNLSVPPLPGVRAESVFAVTLEPAGGRAAPGGETYLRSAAGAPRAAPR
jgi:anti-sigma-K factor RskA